MQLCTETYFKIDNTPLEIFMKNHKWREIIQFPIVKHRFKFITHFYTGDSAKIVLFTIPKDWTILHFLTYHNVFIEKELIKIKDINHLFYIPPKYENEHRLNFEILEDLLDQSNTINYLFD